VVYEGRDPMTGKRRDRWLSGFKTKKEAVREKNRLEAAKDAGERIPEAPARLAYGPFLEDR
jgi:hypothetical protein